MFATARLSLAVAGVALVGTIGGAGATAGRLASADTAARVDGPSPFELTFEGRMGERVDIAKWIHEGSFTSSLPFCASGIGTDTFVARGSQPARSVRVFTCDGGTGTITARMVNYDAEEIIETTGTWQIVAGTGSYASLRGKGEVTGFPLSGNPQQPQTLTFRATWRGIADFDDLPPAIGISRLSATKLRSPSGAYMIRIAFSARDNVQENTVLYGVRAYWPGASRFVVRQGQTRSGEASVSLRVRPTTSVRRIQLQVTASDPLGNERALTRLVRLPS
jgi:hypothetical protein